MVLRATMGQAGPTLVLLHGGYGDWSHWIRTSR